MSDAEWPVLDSEVVWENPYFEAGYDEVEQPDGETGRYYWIEPPDAVAIVAEDEGETILVEQYTPRLRQTIMTCPGGAVEDGESFVEAGIRELREETGFRAGDVELIDVYRAIAWVRMDLAIVHATNLEPGLQELDDGEFLHVEPVPTEEAIGRVRDRSPFFGPGLMPLLLAHEEGLV